MAGLTSTIRAFYSATDDMYVVDYAEAVAVASSDAAESPGGWRWSMFTHGVCADVDDQNHFCWRRVGITGRHLGEPARESLGQRMDQAAGKLDRMYPPDHPGSPGQVRCEEGARLLRAHREAILDALLLAYSENPA